MLWKLGIIVLLFLVQGYECKAADLATAEDAGSQMQIVGGIVLLISMIALVALCASGSVAAGDPIPPWVMTIYPDPSLDVGLSGTSDGINAINNNCVHRHRKGTFETDGARWGAALSKGKHVFEIYWPTNMRGTMATVGVGTADAPLFVKPKDSLVGCNKESWGFDITRRRLLHNGQMLGTMPRAGMVPDKFYMYVDCDGGTLGYGTDHAYWGAPINIPRQNFPVYPMIGSLCPNSQITMIYRGSENRAMAPGAMNVNTVVVPSQGPGGQVQVTVVNPNTVVTANPEYPPPQYK